MFCLWKRMLKLYKRGENWASQEERARGRGERRGNACTKTLWKWETPLISRAWPLFRKWVADQSTLKNYCTASSLHFDKIKINTSVVYIMQAASLREGKCCRLIRVSVIIVGYVRLRLKLNLEAILESKAILLRKSVQAITTKGVLCGCVSRKLKRSWIAVCSFHAIFWSGL